HFFDYFIGLMGLIAGPLAGLFLLGIFVRRAHSRHAWIGVICSLVATIYAKYATDLNGLLFGVIAISVCVGTGYLSALLDRGRKSGWVRK
ncbi:MAG: transporter, partial [Opitutae bacterium]|nr:transporter [Opitutae bacterium]